MRVHESPKDSSENVEMGKKVTSLCMETAYERDC